MGKRKSGTAGIIVILFVVVTLVSVGCASASTYYVNPGGSIQDAVNAADPGDTIIVGDGTYIENIDVNKRLTIKSENGAENCIIRTANPSELIFEVTVDHVTISGFTVEGATGKAGISLGAFIGHCNISDNNVRDNDFGIVLLYSSSNILTNNIANSNDFGIVLYNSSSNILTNNIANSNNGIGINLYNYSSSNILTNNIANSNNGIGINLYNSSSNILTNNIVNSNNLTGINLYNYSSSNTLTNNIANSNKGIGINLYNSSSNILTNNTMLENGEHGIMFGASNENTIANNTAENNGNNGIYLKDSNDNRITDNTALNNVGYHGISLNNLSNNNTILNNLVNSNHYYGIRLGTSSGNTIANNTAENNGYTGIYLEDSNDNRIRDNDASNNVGYNGISLHSSNNNAILNNFVNSNLEQGIGLWTSSGNTIANNTAENNGNNGIYLELSNDNIITDNTALNSVGYHGISLGTSNNNVILNNIANSNLGEGIGLWTSSGNTIANNTAENNVDSGIYIDHSNKNVIANNTVRGSRYGICLIESNNDKIYLNNFISNTHNFYSKNSANIWSTTERITYTYGGKTYTNYLGNYWDDYTGSDADSDGIGDFSYSIDSDKDNYPLMGRFLGNYHVIPTENQPPTVTIGYPTNGQPFTTPTITVSGTASDNAGVSNVEVKVGSGSWQTASGTTSWSKQVTLSSGSNTIYARASDTSWNTKQTSVTVTYTGNDRSIISISVTPGTINLPETVTISGNIIPAHSAIVTLTFTTPTGTISEYPIVSTASGAYKFAFPPNEEGIWFITATWTGDFDTAGNVSKNVSFAVNESKINVGSAIIIAGRKDDDRAQPYIDYTANNAYKVLLKRGFTHERIYYLNPSMVQDANDDGVYDVDRISSRTNVSYAINTWARGNVSVDDPLLIYMVGHGGKNTFIVNGEANTLTASDLDEYLDQLTDATGCYNITVVYEACSSGCFIDELSQTGRIIVTSTGVDADALIDKRGGVFSDYFLNSISAGDTIKNAFETASDSPEIIQHSKLVVGAGCPPQTPLLDDNGDKEGHAAPLPNVGDGLLAASKYIGTQWGVLDFPPTITDVIPSQKVVVNTTITIWAVVVDDSLIEDMYANIIEPNFCISPTNDTLIELNLTTLYLEDSDGDGNFTASFTPTVLGNYTLILHATDEEDNRASPKQCTITVVSSSAIFDTGGGTYPSISGIHNGTIIPNQDIIVHKLCTYPCKGTGGHSEYVKIWNSTWTGVDAYWKSYVCDWDILFNETFVLYKHKTYNYTIITGSYPQIIHESSKDVFGGRITCSEFTDANGHRYNNCIPAIKLKEV